MLIPRLQHLLGRGSFEKTQRGRCVREDYSSSRTALVVSTGLPVNIHGEFDPGSGRTLAACLTHASRTMNLLREGISGERVSNTWAICPSLWDKPWKRGLIPDTSLQGILEVGKLRR